jgi:hypothetical protein
MYLYVAAVIVLILLVVFLRRKEKFATDCLKPEVVTIDSGVPGPCIGMVGSVHGNEPAGAYTLTRMLANNEFKLKKGKVIILPQANPCGLDLNVRENPQSGNDINRQFSEYGGNDETSRYIIEALKTCDVILDFHEGWGFFKETKASLNPFTQISVGSTVTPSNHDIWKTLAPIVVHDLNLQIHEPLKKFSVIWNESCKIEQSLNCYAAKNNRPYMLIETSGQNDIQPMEVREQQNRTIIAAVMRELGVM